MCRNVSLVVLSVAVAAAWATPAGAQSRAKGKKKEPPRVLKEGDEVKVWVDPAEVLRDPALEKAGVVAKDAVAFPACRQEAPDYRFAEFDYDAETRSRHDQAGKIGDRAGVDRMIREGRSVRLPVGTRLLVVYRIGRAADCRARVVEGEHAGKVVEAPIRYLH